MSSPQGSVVTKDVPPYAIVGGNPARIIRFRFAPELIEEFTRLRWWRFSYTHFAELPFEQPGLFLQRLDRLIALGKIVEYKPDRIDVYTLLRHELGLPMTSSLQPARLKSAAE